MLLSRPTAHLRHGLAWRSSMFGETFWRLQTDVNTLSLLSASHLIQGIQAQFSTGTTEERDASVFADHEGPAIVIYNAETRPQTAAL